MPFNYVFAVQNVAQDVIVEGKKQETLTMNQSENVCSNDIRVFVRRLAFKRIKCKSVEARHFLESMSRYSAWFPDSVVAQL